MHLTRYLALFLIGAAGAVSIPKFTEHPKGREKLQAAREDASLASFSYGTSSANTAAAPVSGDQLKSPAVRQLAATDAESGAVQVAFTEVRDGASHRQIEDMSLVPSLRAREVAMDVRVFDVGRESQRKKIDLNLFPDTRLTADVTMKQDDGDVAIEGSIEGDEYGEVYLRRSGSVLVGTIGANGRHYQIQASGRGTQYVMEIDEDRIQQDKNDVVRDDHGSSDETHNGDLEDSDYAAVDDEDLNQEAKASIAANSNYGIKIGVVYSADAKKAAGGQSAVETEIRNEVSKINTAFANSGVKVTMAVGRMNAWGGNQGSTKLQTLLASLGSPNDKTLDDIHSWRNKNKLDLVMLYVPKDKGACGIAYLGKGNYKYSRLGFSVSSRTCNYKHTVTHEIGHNFGADHEPANAGNSSVKYARGAYNVKAGFRTVMAYGCGNHNANKCPRKNFFSSPNREFNGGKTGIANKADNARRVREVAPAVFNYRKDLKKPKKPSNSDMVID